MNTNNINNNEEMSTVDDRFPRHYKGYDMDILITKLDNDEPLTEEEEDIVCEVQHIYYEKYSEKVNKEMEKKMAESEANGIPVMTTVERHYRPSKGY